MSKKDFQQNYKRTNYDLQKVKNNNVIKFGLLSPYQLTFCKCDDRQTFYIRNKYQVCTALSGRDTSPSL